jgi:hypothetical protein
MREHRYNNIRPLVELTKRVTGRQVVWQEGIWCQEGGEILVPRADACGLLHELAHWLVASDEERECSNLMLDEWQDSEVSDLPEWAWSLEANLERVKDREEQAGYLERLVMQDLLGRSGLRVWVQTDQRVFKVHLGGLPLPHGGVRAEDPCDEFGADRIRERVSPELLQEIRDAMREVVSSGRVSSGTEARWLGGSRF